MPTYNTYKRKRNGKAMKTVTEVLANLLLQIKKYLEKQSEIIIVDDGSSDETRAELLRFLKRKGFKQFYKKDLKISYKLSKSSFELLLTILGSNINEGLNLTVVKGYKEAIKCKPEFILKLDTDGEHNSSDFPKLLKYIKKSTNDVKLVTLRDRDQITRKGFGFRIIRYNALSKILYDLEIFAEKMKMKACTRGIDNQTNKLIKTSFGETAIESC